LAAVLSGCGGGFQAGVAPAKGPTMGTLSVPPLDDYTTWLDAPENPVVPPAVDASFARVLYYNGAYMMWTDREAGGGVYLRTSSDGVSWSAPAFCSGISAGARHCAVVLNETLGSLEMWYWTGGNDFSLTSFERVRSTDGQTWTGMVRCASAYTGHRPVYTVWANSMGSQGPSHVFYNGAAPVGPLNYADIWQNRYVMYYHQLRQRDWHSAVSVAVSADGIVWGVPVEGQAVLDTGPAGSWDSVGATWCSILRDAAGLHMYYSGGTTRYVGDGIGYASSLDGMHWAKAPAPIIVKNAAVLWRSIWLGVPSIVEVNGERKLYANGASSTGSADVGLLTQRPPDGTAPQIALDVSAITVSWPPNGTPIPVTISGAVVDAESGLAEASLRLDDEYGELNQTIDLLPALSSDGHFSRNITLIASRHAGDDDGRVYQFTLTARDQAGNQATPITVTVVPPPPDLTALTIALNPPSLMELWPPNGASIPVTLTGSAADSESGLATVTLQVEDEYGALNQTMELLPQLDGSGAFSVEVPLTAMRNEEDKDGRLYRLVLTASDAVGNQAAPLSVSVVVPHNRDNGKPPKPPK